MNYTWGEIQVLSLQKMFLNNDNIVVSDLPDLREDRKYKLYLNSMPALANEGLLRLMSVGKPLVKKYTLHYNMPTEIYDYQTFDTYTVLTEDLTFEGNNSHSYYFELDNTATILIQTYSSNTWTTVQTINHIATTSGSFEIYKGLITNASNLPVRLVFEFDDYIYNIRNIALYNVKFRLEDEVYNNTRKQKFNLNNLISDFYQLISVEYESLNSIGQYNSGCEIEEDKILSINSNLFGNYIITYKAYPVKITNTTSDTYKIQLPSEMVALLPLYIASAAYKDDDIAISTQYRNEFELGLVNLDAIQEPLDFADTSNWL